MALKRGVAPVKQKRHRMQDAAQLVALGSDLMEQASEAGLPLTVDRARMYRDGLIVALLAMRPLRTKNFVTLTLDENLVQRRSVLWIEVPASATKTGQPYSAIFPEQLMGDFRFYLDHVRPYLLARAPVVRGAEQLSQQHLWLSKEGQPLSRNAFFDLVCDHTSRRFGQAVNPHLFRDCTATFATVAIPDMTSLPATMLGHSSSRTAEAYYIRASGVQAGNTMQQHVAALRRKSRPYPDASKT